MQFAIIEIDDGLSIVELQPGQPPEEVAAKQHGILVDAGPFATYEDACDALTELEGEEEEEFA
jgi:hypothetical protein